MTDEQKQIRKSYFKGCEFCNGYGAKCFEQYFALSIGMKKDGMLTLRDVTEHRVIANIFRAQFCPVCGKQIAKKLNEYLD